MSSSAETRINLGRVVPDISVGTVTTGVSGSDASATITGGVLNPVLNLTIPRGGSGDTDLIAPAYNTLSFPVLKGQGCIYNDLYYVANDDILTSEAWDATHWTQSIVGNELARKANADGYYDTLTAGSAEQLISDIREEDNAPYVFRTAGGSIDIGDREWDKLIGGTVCWNQLIGTGVFAATGGTVTTTDGIGTFTANASGQIVYKSFLVTANHVYFAAITYKTTTATTDVCARINGQDISGIASVNWQSAFTLFKTSASITRTIGVKDSRTSGFDAIQAKWVMLIDLTQMFGSTIADYIYGLETATPGAGVAWFKKYFPKDYYAYNAGELMSVNVAQHQMTGFNQWDEEWEAGAINSVTGDNDSTQQRIRSKNYITVLPNTTYYCQFDSSKYNTGRIALYDSNKNYLGTNNGWKQWNAPGQLAVPSNVHYIRFVFVQTSSTYSGGICINLSWDGSRDGEYEPYELHSYDLDSGLELRGIPKLDSNNKLYYDGDTYASDGTVTRKYGIVDLGDLTWTRSTTNVFLSNAVTNIKYPSLSANITDWIIVPKYLFSSPSLVYNRATDKTIAVQQNTGALFVYDTAYTSASDFKTAMSGVYLVYELATPTEATAAEFTNPQVVNDFGTEEYVDAGVASGARDVSIPVGHETQYMANLKAKLEMAPDSPDGDGLYAVRQTNSENEYVEIGASLNHKAEINGEYDDFVAGNAKQLISNTYELDKVPYVYRKSGGEGADRAKESIVGGTVCWNQVIEHGNFDNSITGWESAGDATRTVNNNVLTITASAINAIFTNVTNYIVTNHVYLAMAEITNTVSTSFGFYKNSSSAAQKTLNATSTPTKCWVFHKPASLESTDRYDIRIRINTNDSSTTTIRNVMLFDLTKMYGSTIADYVNTLETATAGSGIALLRSWGFFTKPYYAYDAGTLMSVQAASKKTTGVNQWDEAWESGYVNVDTGVPGSASGQIRSKNYISIFPDTLYYCKSPSNTYLVFYDANKAYVSGVNTSQSNKMFQTPAGVRYMKFYFAATTYENNVCINLSNADINGTYYPYDGHAYPLDSSLTLRGIPKLDSNNKLYYDGDKYEADGTVTRRYYSVTFNGTQTIYFGSYSTNGYVQYNSTVVGERAKYLGIIIADKIRTKFTDPNLTASDTLVEIYRESGMTRILFRDTRLGSTITNVTEWNAALAANPVTVVYEIETPTTETADPYQETQLLDPNGTEEFIDAGVTASTPTRDVSIPVGHETTYPTNLRSKIEEAPNNPTANGDYVVRHSASGNEYVQLVIPNELPTAPTTNGTYKLQMTVSSGTPTLSWVSAS